MTLIIELCSIAKLAVARDLIEIEVGPRDALTNDSLDHLNTIQ